MSRLIVKGLPPNYTEEKLRKHFEGFGQVTDCSLKYTNDGKFRRFAFVGFDNEQSATEAREQCNNTFIGSSRIMVEECKPFGDQNKPRAWSKYAKGSSAYKRLHAEEEKGETVKKESDSDSSPTEKKKSKFCNEKNFEEFMQLQTGAVAAVSNNNDEGNENLMSELLSGIRGDTSLSLIICGLPKTVKAKSIKDWFSPIRLKGLKVVRDSAQALAFVTFLQLSDVKKALKRDGQFFGGCKLEIKKMPNVQAYEEEMHDNTLESKEAEAEAAVAAILETGRLFVRNLPYTCNDVDLRYIFKKYGEISDLQMIISKKTGACKGFAIVTYVFPENAVAAFSALDGSVFKGRMLHILPGQEAREKKDVTVSGKSAFQKAKFAKLKLRPLYFVLLSRQNIEARLGQLHSSFIVALLAVFDKENAGKTHSWNTLFLGANAVAETLAEKLDVDKSDLLLGEGETSAGVRLALAETRLVRETRDYLLANGVCLDAFSRPAAKRSHTVIIAKNLPAKADIDELRRMFERHGPIKQLLIPPGGVTAIVEMENTVDAQKAFNALAYARFRTQPLYLEWAPFDTFKTEKTNENNVDSTDERSCKEIEDNLKSDEPSEEKRSKTKKTKRHMKEECDNFTDSEEAASIKVQRKEELVRKEESDETKKDIADELEGNHGSRDDEDELLPGTTLFVKNLNFKTTSEGLKNKFQSRFRIRSATISTKRDASDPSKTLSMGFGFVIFYRPEDAQQALKEMQGILLDGHCLELKLSHREYVPEKTVTRKGVGNLEQGECTKILIRNIPFQATRKEVKQLFISFGEIRSLRMPKKVGGSAEGHRGFGFVDFLTRADAKRAFNALVHSTHFYGRRLVLEWAKPDDNLEELREKAAANMNSDKKEVRLQKKMMKKIEQDLSVIDDD